MATHKLLTDELRQALPGLYATENVALADKVAVVKYFTPDSSWTWYAVEFDGSDLFFGLVYGLEREFGYFSLKEMEEARGPLGLPIERDLHFTATRLVELDPSLKRTEEASE